MKLGFLFLVLAFGLFFNTSFAQERKVGIEISFPLKQNETIAFDIDLAGLFWRDRILSGGKKPGSKKNKKDFKTFSPATYYFYAVVDIKKNSFDKKKPLADSFMSDELAVKLTSK